MKVLVVYDTTSANRNTEKVAKAIDGVLREKGFDVNCLYVKDVDIADVRNYDCVLAGSPTEAFRATKPIMEFLDNLSKDEFSGKLAAAFDTQMQNRLSGNAAKGIQKKLEKLGFKIVAEPLVTYVEGTRNNFQPKSGEIEKTRNWAQELAKVLINKA
jgi:flavodoxin